MALAGRPRAYRKEVAADICERLAAGETLRKICATPGMPTRSTVFIWIQQDTDGFSDRYAKAMGFHIQAMSDDLLEIADDGANDYIEGEDGPRLNSEHINRSRLRVDTRKWLLSKLRPDKYGDRTTLAGDPNAPLAPPVINVNFLGPKE